MRAEVVEPHNFLIGKQHSHEEIVRIEAERCDGSLACGPYAFKASTGCSTAIERRSGKLQRVDRDLHEPIDDCRFIRRVRERRGGTAQVTFGEPAFAKKDCLDETLHGAIDTIEQKADGYRCQELEPDCQPADGDGARKEPVENRYKRDYTE